MNAIWLLAIGTPVARRIGAARFLIFCAVTAILAAAFYIVLRPDSTAPMIGASGAISALFGGLARFMFQSREAPTGARRRLADRQVLGFAAVWLLLNIGLNASLFGLNLGGNSIAWEAHVGGFLAGILLFPLFDRRVPV
jgi:membrane associated rhomboid family serine protease